MGLAILFFYGLRGAIFRGFFPTTNIISHLLSSVKVELMFGYFFVPNIRLPPKFRQQGYQPNRSPPKELGAGAARGARPPNPPILLLYHKELRLVKCFSKNFFLFIFPLLLYHISCGFVKYFLENFLKKFFKFFLTLTAKCSIIIIERKEKRKT